jgi:hypothetical protein
VIHGHNKGKYSKHDIAFRGMMTCAHDHPTVTAELKKGKYVYYRCSGYHGKCELPRFREDQISEKLGEVLKGICIPDDVAARISSALQHDQANIKKNSNADREADETYRSASHAYEPSVCGQARREDFRGILATADEPTAGGKA